MLHCCNEAVKCTYIFVCGIPCFRIAFRYIIAYAIAEISKTYFMALVSQSVSVYSCTSTRKQRKIHIWNIQLHVNRVRYIARPRKSEALTESGPPYFTH